MPLVGTGYGRGDVEITVRAPVGAIVAYLVEHPGTAITEVYLLAYTDEELTACRKVFAGGDAHRLSGPGRRTGRTLPACTASGGPPPRGGLPG